MRKLTPILVLFFIFFGYAYAHSPGITFEEKVGDYLIEIGANVFEITTEGIIKFNLELFKTDKSGVEEFTNVRVTVRHNGNALLSANIIQPVVGHTSFSYKFPSAGSYNLDVSYEKDDHTLIEKSFPIDVEEGDDGNFLPIKLLVTAAAGMLLGFVAGWKFKKIN